MFAWNLGFLLAGTFFTGYFFGYNWMVAGASPVEMIRTEPIWFILSILPSIYGVSGLVRSF